MPVVNVIDQSWGIVAGNWQQRSIQNKELFVKTIAYFEPALLGFLFSQIQIGGDGALPCIITAGYLGSQLVWPIGIPAQ